MIEFEYDYEDATRALTEFSKDIKDEVEAVLEETFKKVVKEAQSVHRFRNRSGRLVSAVQAEIKGYTARAFIDDGLAPYGGFIHDGFKTWAPDPFLADAFQRNASSIDRAFETSISRVIQRLGL